MDINNALGIVRLMISSGIQKDDAINNPAIPNELREQIRKILSEEENIILEPASMLVSREMRGEWLNKKERSTWYYWPVLRSYLLGFNNWPLPTVRSVDDNTDRILMQFEDPGNDQFDVRGLVVGYVQSGKTANYTALIAKAIDVGYKLVIVLSGIDKGLRRQTQIRLNRELVGYTDHRLDSVPLPPLEKQWVQFTTEEFEGDFQPGFANYATLLGNQPIMLVVKKNGAILRKLIRWLETAPEQARNAIPVLMIDDEADQASIDTKGTYLSENDDVPEDYEEPSVINGLIRQLLNIFQKKTYVAYTATPFANILIPHDSFDPQVRNDLYPKDFIVDLPKPVGYFGAEELFGRRDPNTGEEIGGLDIIRYVPENEYDDLQHGLLPASLEQAMIDFVLAGAGKAQRGQSSFPSTMLLHGSQFVIKHREMKDLISQKFSEYRDEWRYQNKLGIRQRLADRWQNEFIPITRSIHPEDVANFEQIEPFITPFFESTEVLEINFQSIDKLDYEHSPGLKALVIGGNRLSRGLTLEGLSVSYFFRPSLQYDTLMQMGRWFGFRNGYDDLTRIYMTEMIAGWFSDLAMAENELRQDIHSYEIENVTPLELGVRIVKHPTMLVTSRLKQRYSRSLIVEQNYSDSIVQTIHFPFQQIDEIKALMQNNLDSTHAFLDRLAEPNWDIQGPVWKEVITNDILDFLQSYRLVTIRNMSIPLITTYIQRQNDIGELINWTVAVRGREIKDPILGEIDLGLKNPIPMLSRNRLASDLSSLGVITSPGDERIGLSDEQIALANTYVEGEEKLGVNPSSRRVRDPKNGLLLIYPISRFSGHETPPRQSRRPIFEDPGAQYCNDLICIAISFPKSTNAISIIGEFVIGTVDWRPA
jgi:hypothetical protein